MDETVIRKYATMMQELSITRLEVADGDGHISIERDIELGGCDVQTSGAMEPQQPSAPAWDEASDALIVRSPLVGMFYAAPAEDAEPYVSLGDQVREGQTLCIVEAMKLMNEIAAESSGTIAEIYVTNGQVVESGTELFRIDVSRHE